MSKEKRGVPIGAFTSQPLGNFTVSNVDHYVKEKLHVKHYLRYCDDCVMMVKTKKEARKLLSEFDALSSKMGLCIKSNAIISPVGNELKNGKKKNRKRKRSKRTKS